MATRSSEVYMFGATYQLHDICMCGHNLVLVSPTVQHKHSSSSIGCIYDMVISVNTYIISGSYTCRHVNFIVEVELISNLENGTDNDGLLPV